ncbi:unnamed protein product, partial [Amoebophrya sp. A120]
ARKPIVLAREKKKREREAGSDAPQLVTAAAEDVDDMILAAPAALQDEKCLSDRNLAIETVCTALKVAWLATSSMKLQKGREQHLQGALAYYQPAEDADLCHHEDNSFEHEKHYVVEALDELIFLPKGKGKINVTASTITRPWSTEKGEKEPRPEEVGRKADDKDAKEKVLVLRRKKIFAHQILQDGFEELLDELQSYVFHCLQLLQGMVLMRRSQKHVWRVRREQALIQDYMKRAAADARFGNKTSEVKFSIVLNYPHDFRHQEVQQVEVNKAQAAA